MKFGAVPRFRIGREVLYPLLEATMDGNVDINRRLLWLTVYNSVDFRRIAEYCKSAISHLRLTHPSNSHPKQFSPACNKEALGTLDRKELAVLDHQFTTPITVALLFDECNTTEG